MASGYAPDALHERHKRMCELEVAGASDAEIAEALGYSVGRVSIIRSSPLYLALREQLSKETRSKSTFDIAKAIDDLAPKAIRRVEELMANDDNLGVALGATNAVLDRVAPKKTAVEVDQTVRLRISVEQRAAIEAAMAEDDCLDGELVAAPSGLKPLDSAIGEAAAREAAIAEGEGEGA